MTTRDDYVQKMKAQLDDLNAKADELAAKAKDARQEVRAKYREEVAAMRHQSKVAADKLDDLRAAGDDRWDAMTAEMDKLRDAFVHSFRYFKSQV